MGEPLSAFERQEYLNIETFRKSGEGVRTPVWFVVDGGALYVRTGAKSGKVKRIRRDGHVRVAPCDVRGGLKGEWQDAHAAIAAEDECRRVSDLLRSKYKLMETFFSAGSRLAGMENVVIKITLHVETVPSE